MMNDEQKYNYSKDKRGLAYADMQFASKRTCELADEFTTLEVQIATILIAFAGLFITSFQKITITSITVVGLMKFGYASSIFFLVVSLVMGLLHIKRKEKWWEDLGNEKMHRLDKWDETVQTIVSFEEAKAFSQGTNLGIKGAVKSPNWTWTLQTICLGLSIILLFSLFLIVLFNS